MQKPAPIRYPIDLHPGVAKNDTAANGLKALLEATTAINEALNKVADPRSLTKAIREKATIAIRTAQSAHGQANAASESKRKLIREQLQKRSEFEKDIRAWVAAQKSPVAAVRQMISNGDLDGAAAVFRAPSYLSGLDDPTVGTLYTFAKSRFTPDLYEQEQHADDGVQRVARAIETFNKEVARIDKHLNASDEVIAASLLKREDAA
ncbi:MAG: hypothetical protein AB7G35_08750 [Hyphomicrobiaceae bacterium]